MFADAKIFSNCSSAPTLAVNKSELEAALRLLELKPAPAKSPSTILLFFFGAISISSEDSTGISVKEGFGSKKKLIDSKYY